MRDKGEEEMMIRHDRRRWYILIIASVAYLCSHSYLFGTLTTIGFDFLVNLCCVWVGHNRRTSKAPISVNGSIALDCLIRAATIVVGVTINAFASYVFDLSFLYGIPWLYLAVTVAVYVYIRGIDAVTNGRMYADYGFGLGALATLVFFMNFVAYGEPYTFMTEMIYIFSVVCLVAVSDKIQWWAALIFVVFWILAIAAGSVANFYIGKDYRYPISYYFTHTPLLN